MDFPTVSLSLKKSNSQDIRKLTNRSTQPFKKKNSLGLKIKKGKYEAADNLLIISLKMVHFQIILEISQKSIQSAYCLVMSLSLCSP